MKLYHTQLLILSLFLLCFSCKESNNDNTKENEKQKKIELPRPLFDADSAYQYIQKQVDFGPRVPGTQPHKDASLWLKTKLSSYTDTAFIQTGEATMYNGKQIPIYNIIGSINPEIPERILLAAHWDSRHVADKDFDKNKTNQPIDGANDGASGVGVLIEIARQLQNENTHLGVDIIFFDAEDLGTPVDSDEPDSETWCLGSQYWAQNPHIANYKAQYGILLDMVGASDAVFKFETYAYRKAAPLYMKTWNMAHRFDYQDKFIKAAGGAITDDHYFVTKYRNFPMINIIDYEPQRQGGFGHYHHTHQDNMDVISKSTLQAVGETVLGVLKY